MIFLSKFDNKVQKIAIFTRFLVFMRRLFAFFKKITPICSIFAKFECILIPQKQLNYHKE